MSLALLVLFFVANTVSGVPSGKTVTLNNGVVMPSINLGTCCGSDPKVGLASWLAAGGTVCSFADTFFII